MAMKKWRNSPSAYVPAPPSCKAPFPSSPAAITSGTFFPNKMMAWVMSKAHGNQAAHCDCQECVPFPQLHNLVVRRRPLYWRAIDEEAQNLVSGKAAKIRSQRSDI